MKPRAILAGLLTGVILCGVVGAQTPVVPFNHLKSGNHGSAVAQGQACLHDGSETPEQLTRRRAAIGYAREINTAEASQYSIARSYAPIAALANVSTAPSGFIAQLSTDGKDYVLSIKDSTDPCRFALFSDQNGVIYTGAPLR